MSKVLELTKDLVSRVSLTPEDAGCQRLIASRLMPLGFEIEWFHCGDVINVVLTHGRGHPSFWFLGHTDVVPPGPLEAWTSPPFEPAIRDGFLYGRGAADMKGGVAAMVVALESFVGQNPQHPGQVGLLLTSDEEGAALDGVRQVAEILKYRDAAPDYCLVGEPSSRERLGDVVRIGRRGSFNGLLTVNGVQGHTAFPHKVRNPVHELAPFVVELTTTQWDDGTDDFPPTGCQVSNIQAGTGAENVTPAVAVLHFNFRNSPASPHEEVVRRVEAMLERHAIRDFDLEWFISGHPFQSPPGALNAAVASLVPELLGVTPDMNTGGGTSDGRFIAPLGSEVLELGPVNDSIHQIDERVRVADLEKLPVVYETLIRRLLLSA
jgi:succinyl-diaminopimelate desuccinylase